MEMIKPEKQFDAIAMIRETREKMSVKIQHMSFLELKPYILQKLAEANAKLVGQRWDVLSCLLAFDRKLVLSNLCSAFTDHRKTVVKKLIDAFIVKKQLQLMAS